MRLNLISNVYDMTYDKYICYDIDFIDCYFQFILNNSRLLHWKIRRLDKYSPHVSEIRAHTAVHNSTLMYNESVRIFSRMQELAFPRRKGILAPVSVLVLLILPLVDLPSANGESPTNRPGVCLHANTYIYIYAWSSSVRVYVYRLR